MKKGILIIVLLSLVGLATFAQTKKPLRKKKPVTTAKKPATSASNSTAAGKKPDTTATSPVKITQIVRPDTMPPKEKPLNGFYVRSSTTSAKPTPYAVLREADVVFEKMEWREIDLRERMNQYLISPKKRLIDVLVNAIKNDELTAYDPTPTKIDVNGDEFTAPLTKEKALSRLADSTLVHHFDKTSGADIGATMVAGEFNPDSVLKFRIKEVWMFDKQRSVFEPRMLGIAPLVKPRSSVASSGENDYQPAFWIYYPEARKILASQEAELNHNDATGLSFDQVLLKRIFTSYIVKESNDKDERIKDYAQGIDKLYESERIKKALMDYELELWKYGN